MTRRVAATAVTALLAIGLLAGCDQVDQATQGATKAKDCAAIISKVTGIDFDPKAAPGEVRAKAKEVEDAVDNADSEDVKRAGQTLVSKIEKFAQALGDAKPAEVRAALTEVRDAAEQVARACNVPVDQLTGSGS
jgi:hypothetical protein